MRASIRWQAVGSIVCVALWCVALSAEAASPLRDRMFSGDTEEISFPALIITEDTTWNSATDLSHYDDVSIREGATVTIEPGSVIKIRYISLLEGNIVAKGTPDQMITITRVPFSYPSYAQYDACTEGCVFEVRGTILSWSRSNNLTFEYVRFTDLGGFYKHGSDDGVECADDIFEPVAAIQTYGGKITIAHSIFDNNQYADIHVDIPLKKNTTFTEDFVHVSHSDFRGNADGRILRSFAVFSEEYRNCESNCDRRNSVCSKDPRGMVYCCWEYCLAQPGVRDPRAVIFTDNWYGGPDEPMEGDDNTIETSSGSIYGDVTMDGWNDEPHFTQGSSVLFLPGIKASRLYGDNVAGKSVKVWEPSNDFETSWLQFREDGTPYVDDGVYTKEIIDEVAVPIVGGNIYKSLIGDFRRMKEHHAIADYLLYAYDWRYDLNDILFNGTMYPDGERKKLVAEIERLAATSYSGKVTIVAHSNGGLLAKALARELEIQGKDHLVDNVVLVGSPQMGTPKSILSFLYGYDEKLSIPWFMDNAKARTLINAMPGAYALLPSAEYFQRTKDAVIRFRTNADPYQVFTEAYGDAIDDYDVFARFMTGEDDRRDKPARDAVDREDVINKHLLKRADVLHDAIDAWTPSGKITVTQIAGWGLDTIQGVDYREGTHEDCQATVDAFDIEGVDCAKENQPFYEPRYTVDGDDVVVTPSALMMEGAQNVKRYWVDLEGYNKKFLTSDKTHSNILEMDNIRTFINDIIINHYLSPDLPKHLSNSRPDGGDTRIRMALYSPLDVHLYDQDGNHTGPTTIVQDGKKTTVMETAIPNSYYDVLDGRTYVGWSAKSDVRVELEGYGAGVYTVALQEIAVTKTGEKTVGHITFADLPTSDATTARFAVANGDLATMTPLAADYDGDGTDDYTLAPRLNSTIRLTGTEEAPQIAEENTVKTQPAQQQKQKKAPKKASIDRWTVAQRVTSSTQCSEKIDVTLFGKHFDKEAIVRIGGTKAKSVTHHNSKKIVATFCAKDLRAVKTDPLRSITVQNPKTKADKAAKKINVTFFVK